MLQIPGRQRIWFGRSCDYRFDIGKRDRYNTWAPPDAVASRRLVAGRRRHLHAIIQHDKTGSRGSTSLLSPRSTTVPDSRIDLCSPKSKLRSCCQKLRRSPVCPSHRRSHPDQHFQAISPEFWHWDRTGRTRRRRYDSLRFIIEPEFGMKQSCSFRATGSPSGSEVRFLCPADNGLVGFMIMSNAENPGNSVKATNSISRLFIPAAYAPVSTCLCLAGRSSSAPPDGGEMKITYPPCSKVTRSTAGQGVCVKIEEEGPNASGYAGLLVKRLETRWRIAVRESEDTAAGE